LENINCMRIFANLKAILQHYAPYTRNNKFWYSLRLYFCFYFEFECRKGLTVLHRACFPHKKDVVRKKLKVESLSFYKVMGFDRFAKTCSWNFFNRENRLLACFASGDCDNERTCLLLMRVLEWENLFFESHHWFYAQLRLLNTGIDATRASNTMANWKAD